jgi:peptidyl-prolyl cis-trans isomerase SurA
MAITLPALCLVFVAAATGEVIDRIAVTINNRVITESEILRQIRITAFMNAEKPDFSAESKRSTADRLVEQALIRREIETSRYITAPASSKALYDQLRQRYKGDNEYLHALKEYEIADEDIQQAFEWQETLLEFVSVRFRPGIQLTESDLKEYYDLEIAPKAAASGEKLSFEDARERIESILTQQRVDNALDRWLGQVRTQSRIRYRREVLP